jgi:hypothetical protein
VVFLLKEVTDNKVVLSFLNDEKEMKLDLDQPVTVSLKECRVKL